MNNNTGLDKKTRANVDIEYPDFATVPENVGEKFENLTTKVNFFRLLG